MTCRMGAGAMLAVRTALAALVLALSLTGAAAQRAAPAQPVAEVFLLRGLFNVFSYGLDDLGRHLRAAGIAAHVDGFGASADIARRIVQERRAARSVAPLVLIGHSLGGNEVIALARALGEQGVAVDLVVTIDPTAPQPVPANVRRAVNFFISSGVWGAPIRAGAGFRGALNNADLATNRRDLAASGDGHAVIDKNPAVHREIVAMTRSLRRQQRR